MAAGVDTRQTPFALCRDVKAAYDARIAAEDASTKGAESVDTVQRAHARLVKHKARLADERLTFLVWLAVTRKGSEFRVPEDIAWPSSQEGNDQPRMQVQTQGDVRAAVDEAEKAHAHLGHANAYASARLGEANASAATARYWKHIKDQGADELAAKEARARECRNMLPGLQSTEENARLLLQRASAAHQEAQQRLQSSRLSFDNAVSSAEQERDQWSQQARTAKDEAQRLEYQIRSAKEQVSDYERQMQQRETEDPELETRLGVAKDHLAGLQGEYGAADESGRSAASNAERAQQRVAQAKTDRDRGLPPLEQAAARTKQDSDAAQRAFQDAEQRHQQIRDEVEGLDARIDVLRRDVPRAPVEEPRAAEKAAADQASYSAAASLASAALDAAKTATETMRRQRVSQLQDLQKQARQTATRWIDELQKILPAQVRLDDSLADMLFDLPSASLRVLEETLWELASSKNPLTLASAGTELPGHAVGVRLQVPALHSARHQLADMCQERESWTEVYERARAPRETELKWIQLLLPITWTVETDGADPVLSIGAAKVSPVAQSSAVWAKAPKAAAQPAQPTGPAAARPSGAGAAASVPAANKPKNKGLRIVLTVVAVLLIVPCILSLFAGRVGTLLSEARNRSAQEEIDKLPHRTDGTIVYEAEHSYDPQYQPVVAWLGQLDREGWVRPDLADSAPEPTLSAAGFRDEIRTGNVLYVSTSIDLSAPDWDDALSGPLLRALGYLDGGSEMPTIVAGDPEAGLNVSYSYESLDDAGSAVVYRGRVIAVYEGERYPGSDIPPWTLVLVTVEGV